LVSSGDSVNGNFKEDIISSGFSFRIHYQFYVKTYTVNYMFQQLKFKLAGWEGAKAK
jgi:hypothetical protein